MPRARPAVSAAPSASGSANHFSTQSLLTVEDRLAAAERELKVQFTRIAQLQAQLDRMLMVVRAAPSDPHHSK